LTLQAYTQTDTQTDTQTETQTYPRETADGSCLAHASPADEHGFDINDALGSGGWLVEDTLGR
jgi:hypothetical protein